MPREAFGRCFAAITDPGLDEARASSRRTAFLFRKVFLGDPEIGGRYSALSVFGLVPAALVGVEVAELLERTERMIASCSPSVPAPENEGSRLGIRSDVLAHHGRDKVTFASSRRAVLVSALARAAPG